MVIGKVFDDERNNICEGVPKMVVVIVIKFHEGREVHVEEFGCFLTCLTQDLLQVFDCNALRLRVGFLSHIIDQECN